MILKRFYDEKLAQASYLVGCAATGEALVVDPNRDVAQYVEAAESEGLRLTHVTETHIHADFVSGLLELSDRTGARAYLSDEGGPDWRYAFASSLGAELLRDGSEFMVGNVRVQVMHTPGHTPEHVSFIITDTAGADQPMGVFTGDFVFVGDVGRPDLLEKAAGVTGTMEAGARQLHDSLRRFAGLSDWVQLWPGHGAGSACGKALGAVPSTTLGYEKLFNWAFSHDEEPAFVDAVLAGQPEPPKYFAEMKRLNRDGPRVLGGFPSPRRKSADELTALVRAGDLVVDARPWAAFRAGHVQGVVNIPLNRSFTTWAGWLIPYDRDFHLIVENDAEHGIAEAVRDLAMIGLDRIAGFFTEAAVSDAVQAGGRLATLSEVSPSEARRRFDAGEAAVLDVRGTAEWEAGRVPGVAHIPLGYLPERLDEVPRDRPVIVYCQSGARSAIAASVLAAAGITDVFNLAGGYQAWLAAGHPTDAGVLAA
ncbi:MAG TPA: rhodanese-like domain-containing protein [Longimicrobiales bacterium]|nr:rhodanese-like domain-containing protein [Longimicrobiales bacterium]